MSMGRHPRVAYRCQAVTVTDSGPDRLVAHASVHRDEVLAGAVDEAARLVDARGSMVFLRDPADGFGLRLTSLDPVPDADVRRWERALRHPRNLGGILAMAMTECRTLATEDYPIDPAFGPEPVELRSVRRFGVRAIVAAPLVIDGTAVGVLAVYSDRPAAFTERDQALLTMVADHAAVTVANVRLIDELAGSRAELSRRVENERSLREIAARFAAITDPALLLQHVVDEANRLVDGDGAILDVVEPGTRILAWAYDSGMKARFGPDDIVDYTLPIGVGLTGRAVEERRVLVAGDDLVKEFPPSHDSDRFFELTGFRSMIAAPIGDDTRPLGALEVYSTRPNAFDDDDAALVGALADHAAVALLTARQMADLTESRADVARRADAEQSLREIAARLTAIREPSEVIQHAVDESVRLLGADQARIELDDAATGTLRAAYISATDRTTPLDDRARAGRPRGTGVGGKVVADGRPFFTGDYLNDERFVHDAKEDAYVEKVGLISVLSVPLVGDDGIIGVLSVGANRRHAFAEDDSALLEALATQVSVAFATARLFEAIDRSSRDIARRAEAELALREIAARITALRDPATILEQTAAEVGRLLGADGATIDLFDPIGTSSGFWFGLGAERDRAERAERTGPTTLLDIDAARGVGISGVALETGEPVATGDYLADDRFTHEAGRDAFIRAEGIHSVMAAPLTTEDGPVGVINVHSVRTDAFGPDELRIIGAIADLATIAVTNARLLERLNRSADELVRRADIERALREIAVRLTGIRDPAEVLQLTVDEAVRILRADGAILDLIDPERNVLRGAYDSQMADRLPDDRLRRQELVLGRGVSGRAVVQRQVIVTGDYLTDDRFEHDPDADDFVREAGIRSMIAAPLIGGGGPVGVLEVYSGRPDAFGPGAVAVLEAFAGQAAVAIGNARLYERLETSEAQYRLLVTSSPDLIWSADADGRFTFISDASRDLLGRDPSDLIGHHFSEVVAPQSQELAAERWGQLLSDPARRQFVPLDVLTADGSAIPTEITAIGIVVDGRLVGIHGSTRDVRARDRLERELRRQSAEIAASEERAHLARELHDSVTQALFSMTLITRSIEMLLERDPSAAGERLGTLRELQRDALAEMRALIFELRPGSLERDGLVQALRTHAAAVEGRTGLSIVVDCAELPDRLSLGTEDVLYRIGQEALHNVVKHADATHARVEVAEGDGVATLTVEDDGVGFDPHTVPTGHLGIEGMRARAERAGGSLEIEAAVGRGTRVRATLPRG